MSARLPRPISRSCHWGQGCSKRIWGTRASPAQAGSTPIRSARVRRSLSMGAASRVAPGVVAGLGHGEILRLSRGSAGVVAEDPGEHGLGQEQGENAVEEGAV